MIVQELVATLGLQVDEQVFDRVGKVLGALGTGLVGLGVAAGTIAVGIGVIVQSTASAGDAIGEMAEKVGISADVLQELQHVAVMGGASFDGLVTGLKKLSKNAVEASEGSESARDAFRKVGVSVRDATGQLKSGDVLLEEIAGKFASMPNGVAKTALAMELFGRSGADLIPLLNKGKDGISDLRQEARDLGLVMDGETLQASSDYDDATNRLGASLVGLRNAIGGPLIKGFAAAAQWLANLVKHNRVWIASKVVAVAKTAGAAFGVLGKVLKVVADNMAIVNFVLGVATVYYLIGRLQAVMALTAAELAWGRAAVYAGARAAAASLAAAGAGALAALPWLLLAGAIVLVFDELYTFATGGDSLLGRMIKWFDSNDPSDSAFVQGIKSIGSLIFDFTNPKKWEHALSVWAKIVDDVISVIERRLDNMWGGLGKVARIGLQMSAAVPLHALAEGAILFGDGSSSPAASVAAQPGGKGQFYDARTYSPQVNVSVAPGANADEVKGAVQTGLDEWFGGIMHDNFVAVDQ